MNVEEIKKIVADQKEELSYIYKNEKIIEREVSVKNLTKYLKHPNILAILGPRRCGKSIFSTMLYKNKEYGYINFDDERIANITTKELNLVLQAFYELYGQNIEYIILDEIQNINGWEKFVNRLRRTKKVIITGSNSRLLSGELSTHLTGRHIDFTLYPFSFNEYLTFHNKKYTNKDLYSTKKTAEIKNNLEKYMKNGGYPEVYKFGRTMLARTYEDIIHKDILLRYNIKNKKTFSEIAKFLVSNFSKETTYKKIKDVSQIKNVHTIKNYVDYLTNAYLIIILERFSFKLKNQSIAPKKTYCIDSGIINSVAFRFSDNKGRLMENIVCIELLRRKSYNDSESEIYYWKDHQQREVDFVIKNGQSVEGLIQVTNVSSREEIENREITSLIKSSKDLKCKNLLLITWGLEDEIKENNMKIRCIPLWKWLIGS